MKSQQISGLMELLTLYVQFQFGITGRAVAYSALVFLDNLAGTIALQNAARAIGTNASGPIPRYRGMVAQWHAHLHGFTTAIHETSGLSQLRSLNF